MVDEGPVRPGASTTPSGLGASPDETRPRRVLVTGATGFVGRRLVPALEARGHTVEVARGRLDVGPLQGGPCDVIVHLAARIFVPDSWSDPTAHVATNVLGTSRVLDHCRQQGARLVHLSSYVYGVPDRLPITEDAPRAATNPYALSKVLAEELCEFHARVHGTPILVVRPFNLYGPGQDGRFLIPSLARQLLDPTADRVEVAGARTRRDHLFVDDLVALLVLGAERGVTGPVNAGSGTSLSAAEVHDRLGALAGIRKPLVDAGDRRPGEIDDIVADVSRARDLLGWSPRTTIEDGLRAVLDGPADGSRAPADRRRHG